MKMKNYQIYKKIKEEIIYLKLKPKEKLDISSLAKEYKISTSPIREALFLLESEGLVISVPYSGFFVSDISFREIKDMFEFRMFLLKIVGELAAKRITENEIKDLELILEKIKRSKSMDNLIKLENYFHSILNNTTKNKTLANTTNELEDKIDRLWFFTNKDNKYHIRIPNDFNNMISALKKKDGEALSKALKDHAEAFITAIKKCLY